MSEQHYISRVDQAQSELPNVFRFTATGQPIATINMTLYGFILQWLQDDYYD
jgi:hypothetical protein